MTRQIKCRKWAMETTRTALKRRTSQEWKLAIDRLRCSRVCRLLAAQVVWWDYFAKKPANPHDATLDGYKADWEYMVVTRAPIRVRKASLAAALVAMGYLPEVAAKRSEVIT